MNNNRQWTEDAKVNWMFQHRIPFSVTSAKSKIASYKIIIIIIIILWNQNRKSTVLMDRAMLHNQRK